MPLLSLPQVIQQLQALYGEPDPPEVTDPWELILWENVAYLVDDDRRRAAMTVLRERVGINPAQILGRAGGSIAGSDWLRYRARPKCGKASPLRGDRASRVRRRPAPILKRPLAQAKKALKRFPGIGDPSAEKILLFCHAFPLMSLESNGLRRVGAPGVRRGEAKLFHDLSPDPRSDQGRAHQRLSLADQCLPVAAPAWAGAVPARNPSARNAH